MKKKTVIVCLYFHRGLQEMTRRKLKARNTLIVNSAFYEHTLAGYSSAGIGQVIFMPEWQGGACERRVEYELRIRDLLESED